MLLSSVPGASVNVQNPWLQTIPEGNRAMQCVSFLSVETHNPTKQPESHFHASGFTFGKIRTLQRCVKITQNHFMIYLFGMSLIVCVLGSGPLTLRSKTHKVKFRAIDCFFTAQVPKKKTKTLHERMKSSVKCKRKTTSSADYELSS